MCINVMNVFYKSTKFLIRTIQDLVGVKRLFITYYYQQIRRIYNMSR